MPPTLQQFEGPSIEKALAAAASALGADLQVTDARRIRAGGIMGFFAREHYEVTAEAAPAPTTRAGASPPLPVTTPLTPSAEPGDASAAIDATLRSLVAGVEAGEDRVHDTGRSERRPTEPTDGAAFAQHLAANLRVEDPPRPTTVVDRIGSDLIALDGEGAIDDAELVDLNPPRFVAPAAVAGPHPSHDGLSRPEISPARAAAAAIGGPAVALAERLGPNAATGASVEDAPTTGEPAWSRRGLAAIGVPKAILDRMPISDPDSDLEWTAALGRAISSVAPDAGRPTEATRVVVSGRGRAAALDLMSAATSGFTPHVLRLDGHDVAATPSELALAVRGMLPRQDRS